MKTILGGQTFLELGSKVKKFRKVFYGIKVKKKLKMGFPLFL